METLGSLGAGVTEGLGLESMFGAFGGVVVGNWNEESMEELGLFGDKGGVGFGMDISDSTGAKKHERKRSLEILTPLPVEDFHGESIQNLDAISWCTRRAVAPCNLGERDFFGPRRALDRLTLYGPVELIESEDEMSYGMTLLFAESCLGCMESGAGCAVSLRWWMRDGRTIDLEYGSWVIVEASDDVGASWMIC
ncbi:hypothetical protein KM043_001076 [Ampulex compressa]|nr:hypothetical protein KM043_001076 [Ampulex compressa]